MPIYEYECQQCGYTIELLQKYGETSKTPCPHCTESWLTKRVSAPAFHLKGTGWYVTDHRDGGKPQSLADKHAKSDGGDSKSTDTSSSGSGASGATSKAADKSATSTTTDA